MQEQMGLGTIITVVVACFAVIEVLGKIIEKLLDKFLCKKNGYAKCVFADATTQIEARKNIDDLRNVVNNLDKVINSKDESGVPMVYFPRIYLHLQDKLLDRMEDLSKGQERLANLLAVMEKTMEKLVERIEKLM